MIYQSVLNTIGETPIVKLEKLPKNLSSPLYTKVEFFNPGASVKDRIAIYMIDQAEKRGELKPGGTIVEATSGNTGMGIAMVSAVRGYKAVFVMPDKMSLEKIQALRAFGAKVVVTPTNVEPEDSRSYYKVAERIVNETPNCFYANQYHNPDNPRAHYEVTGPEVWKQTEGKITSFIAGMGTGGTISGVGRYLKEKNPKIRIIGVDPEGSVFTELKRSGEMGKPFPYMVEGVGEDFVPSTIDLDIIDEVVQVSDKESFQMARRLARQEGLFVGGSCGSAVAGALKWLANQSSEKFPLVLLPDSGSRYLSKVFNDDWMRENGFSDEADLRVSDVLTPHEVIVCQPEDKAKECIEKLKKNGISQLPVVDHSGKVIGMVSEQDLLRAVMESPKRLEQAVENMMEHQTPKVSLQTPISKVQELLKQDQVAVVTDDSKILGLLTKIDLLEYFVRQGQSLKGSD